MADDGVAAVIAAGGTYEPIGSELPQFCNRPQNALNDKSRLRRVKAVLGRGSPHHNLVRKRRATQSLAHLYPQEL